MFRDEGDNMSASNLQLVESHALPYLLSIPEATDQQSATKPLLCFLHGYDEGAPMQIHRALTQHGPLRPGNPPSVTAQFIVVAPQLPVRGDLWYRYADVVQNIVQQVQSLHNAHSEQRFLTGFSFGGNGVFDLALQQLGFWAALWSVDPTRAPEEDPGSPVWLSSGEVSRRRERRFIERLHLEKVHNETPGDRVYVDQGQDHVGTATLAYRDERIYRWLLSRGR